MLPFDTSTTRPPKIAADFALSTWITGLVLTDFTFSAQEIVDFRLWWRSCCGGVRGVRGHAAGVVLDDGVVHAGRGKLGILSWICNKLAQSHGNVMRISRRFLGLERDENPMLWCREADVLMVRFIRLNDHCSDAASAGISCQDLLQGL